MKSRHQIAILSNQDYCLKNYKTFPSKPRDAYPKVALIILTTQPHFQYLFLLKFAKEIKIEHEVRELRAFVYELLVHKG